MSETIVTNQVDFTALYGEDLEPVVFSSNIVKTTIIHGITATKAADKEFWVDGPLTYTVTIHNESGQDLTDVEFRDYLDPSLIALDTTYGVYVDGAPTTFSYMSFVLSVSLPLIAEDATKTIVFRVLQA